MTGLRLGAGRGGAQAVGVDRVAGVPAKEGSVRLVPITLPESKLCLALATWPEP
jgi:hypothetical protein